MFFRETTDERGQGHHQSMTENPACEFTRTPEVRVLIMLATRHLNANFRGPFLQYTDFGGR